MIPTDGAPGHPLNPDATGDLHCARSAAMAATVARREAALVAGVPLLTLALVDALTAEQRAASLAVWAGERP